MKTTLITAVLFSTISAASMAGDPTSVELSVDPTPDLTNTQLAVFYSEQVEPEPISMTVKGVYGDYEKSFTAAFPYRGKIRFGPSYKVTIDSVASNNEWFTSLCFTTDSEAIETEEMCTEISPSVNEKVVFDDSSTQFKVSYAYEESSEKPTSNSQSK